MALNLLYWVTSSSFNDFKMNAPHAAINNITPEQPPTKRGLERRTAFMLSAADLFLHKGFDAVSLDDIVQHAGGSKATLYKYFGNKEGLFSAICDYRRDRIFENIVRPFDAKQQHLHDYLQQTLTRFYQHLVQPETIAFLRLLMEQSQRNPDLAESLYEKCATRMQHNVADALQQCHDEGLIECAQPLHSAVLFFGILGDLEWKILMGLPVAQYCEEQSKYIDYSVKLFLKAHQRF